MFFFTRPSIYGTNFNLTPGSNIVPIVTVYNSIGSVNNSISLKNTNAIIKDIPQKPTLPFKFEYYHSNSSIAYLRI